VPARHEAQPRLAEVLVGMPAASRSFTGRALPRPVEILAETRAHGGGCREACRHDPDLALFPPGHARGRLMRAFGACARAVRLE
jgi:hypothetical protein